MIELTPETYPGFVGSGDALLMLCAPGWRLERTLEVVGQRLPSLRLGLVDVERFPRVANGELLAGYPTCDLYRAGLPRARLVGDTSLGGVLRWLARSGVGEAGAVGPRALLDRAVDRADLAEAQSPEQLETQLEQLLADPTTAYNRLARHAGSAVPWQALPAFAACARQVSTLARAAIRRVRDPATPVLARAGLAAALEELASERADGPGEGLMVDWLVLHAAFAEFFPTSRQGDLHERGAAGAVVAAMLPAQTLARAMRFARSLAHLGRVLNQTSDTSVELLLEDMLRAAPGPWEPRVNALESWSERPAARLAAGWCRPPVAVESAAWGQLVIRLTDGTTVSVTVDGLAPHP